MTISKDLDRDDPFDSPGSSEFVQWEDHVDELIVFVPKRYEAHVQTMHTKPDEKSPCVVADVYVLTGEGALDEEGNELELGGFYEEQMIFQAFHHRLKNKLPENGRVRFVLARLTQGPKQRGMKPPWILQDVKEVPADMAIGREWFAAFKAAEEAKKAKGDPFD